jgi:hypothetical protein
LIYFLADTPHCPSGTASIPLELMRATSPVTGRSVTSMGWPIERQVLNAPSAREAFEEASVVRKLGRVPDRNPHLDEKQAHQGRAVQMLAAIHRLV